MSGFRVLTILPLTREPPTVSMRLIRQQSTVREAVLFTFLNHRDTLEFTLILLTERCPTKLSLPLLINTVVRSRMWLLKGHPIFTLFHCHPFKWSHVARGSHVGQCRLVNHLGVAVSRAILKGSE